MSSGYQESTLDSLVSKYVDTLRLPERLLSTTRDYMSNAHLREAWGVRYMAHCAFRYGASALSGGVVLEAGCGSGGSIPHLAPLFDRVIGTDIDLPAILIAKKRCEQLGVSDRVQLVAAALEQPIFPAASFDAIKCTDVLEHVQDPVRSCSLLGRALRPGGGLFVLTPNKWSIWSPEPHVRLWGVQYLPPRWADAYVKFRIGIPYRNVANLISYRRFVTMLQQTGLAVVFIPIEDKHLNPRSVRGINIKFLFSRGPLAWLSRVARFWQPTLEAICLASPASDERATFAATSSLRGAGAPWRGSSAGGMTRHESRSAAA
jgi:2-polyprenyl-3-methyl-5-hydroxy-6-metoxy-1,4-benzoquinol methylase